MDARDGTKDAACLYRAKVLKLSPGMAGCGGAGRGGVDGRKERVDEHR